MNAAQLLGTATVPDAGAATASAPAVEEARGWRIERRDPGDGWGARPVLVDDAGAEVRPGDPIAFRGRTFFHQGVRFHAGHGIDFVDLREGRSLGSPGATIWEHQVASAGLTRAELPVATGDRL